MARVAPALFVVVALLTAGCGGGNSNSGGGSTPTAPILSLSATTLSFGSIVLGASSAAQTVTVTNTGTAALTISNVAISGDFTQTNSGCTASIAVSATCTLSVTFTPTALGARTGTLTLTSNGTGSPQAVSLTGTGTAPLLGLSATTLTFGNTSVGFSSTAQTVTVTNTGTAPLTISKIAVTGDYSVTNTGCSATLAVNATCQIAVIFTPTTTGTRTGTLTLTSNGTGSPQTVSLTGTGTAPGLSLSATTLNLGSIVLGASSAAQTVTVTNTGTAPLTISNISITGDFAQTSSGCAVSIAVSGTCTISILFTPTAVGTRTGTLTVTSNGPSSPQTVSLTGTGTAPILGLSVTSLTFGNIVVGTPSAAQTVTVTNIGTAPLTISNIAITGDYSETSTGCSATLAINATCQIAVIFTPTTSGTRTGTLTLTSNGTGSPQTVALTGAGIYTGVSFQITVLAGTKPIAGTSLILYAAGSSGNGTSPYLLERGSISTNSSGVATIPSTYNCPSGASLVYVLGSGGTVSGAPSANPNIDLMTALGPCSGIAAGAKFVMDEATSVAAVEALAPFYGPGGLVGASATNLTGLTNAFATAATLADPVAGTSPGSTLPSNAASPAARVNSLANLLNTCVVSSSACASLYTDTAQGTTQASNTLDAAYYLAKNPTNNVAALYALSLSSTAYTPVLAAVPTDWTMFVNYSGGGLDSPSGIGVDSKGNVWVANYFYVASEFTPIGAAVFPSGITGSGLNNSYGLAIDLKDNVWIPNEQPFTSVGIGSVSELSSTGTSLAGNGYINGGLNYPLSAAIDPNGTVWVVDYGNSHLTLLNSSGVPLSGTTGYTTPLFAFPVAVAVDANHFGWIVNQSSNNITKVAPDGSSFINYSCCNLASGVAIDQGDNIWVANYFGNSVSLLTNSGTVISSSYTANGAINHPQGIAVDGAGTVWVANYRAPYLSALSGSISAVPGTSLSPAAGLGGDAGLLEAYAIALDASGDIWVSNAGNNTITKFIGLAAPVKTPLSALPQLP